MRRLFVVCLGPGQAADELLARSLGRSAAAETDCRLIIVHASGGFIERRLFASGQESVYANGVLVVSGEETRLVDPGAREVGKFISAMLTEEGIAAVPIHGADRAIVRRGPGGQITADWDFVGRLVSTGAVPVISAVASQKDPSGVREVESARLAAALVRSAAASGAYSARMIFLAPGGKAGLYEAGHLLPAIDLDVFAETAFWLPGGSVGAVDLADLDVCVTSSRLAFSDTVEVGTRIVTGFRR